MTLRPVADYCNRFHTEHRNYSTADLVVDVRAELVEVLLSMPPTNEALLALATELLEGRKMLDEERKAAWQQPYKNARSKVPA